MELRPYVRASHEFLPRLGFFFDTSKQEHKFCKGLLFLIIGVQ